MKVKDPTTYLRTETKRSFALSALERKSRALNAAIEYMIARGAFKDYNLTVTGANASANGQRYEIVPVYTSLEWNPEAPVRIRFLRLIAVSWRGDRHEEVSRVTIPHWDYDGCDPAIRKAWEIKEVIDDWETEQRRRRLQRSQSNAMTNAV